MPTCKFEDIDTGEGKYSTLHMKRARVPGGWLVIVYNGNDEQNSYAKSVAFYPDPNHSWNGNSLPPK